ncbi:sugar transporter ERD6-like 6 [Aphis craccivora]|uniref:Sugar transporter ERD6-like 6 n=1 Tax=Aphis craccivora TaxID=307492 RepID=A0A6G0ZDY5_APHCR|nr:sugar transporter ERD6-like 6 [Aphis craccivora]
MYGTKWKIEADFISPLLASSCALTIGLNLNWWPLNKVEGQPPDRPNFTDEQLDNGVATMYLVAISWSQWSGTYVGRVGPYALMAFGVSVSMCGSILASLFSCHVYGMYAVRVLQGFGCASLAVAVPEYIMMSNANIKDSYQSEYYALPQYN